MKTGIYMIRNKINDKKYIGQAVDIDRRWSEHINELNNNKHINRYLQNSWNKYGADNFEFTIICQCLEQDLDRLEIHYIAHYDTYNNGYNLSLGGDGTRGYKFTDEQLAYRQSDEYRKIHSESRKEYFKDPENRAKIIESVREKCAKAVYCVTNDTVYASVREAEEKLNMPGGGGTVSWACKGKYRWGNGHIYKKLGLEFWFLDEWEGKFGKAVM